MADTREPGAPRASQREDDPRRRARLDAVFGEVLPETTGDERDRPGERQRPAADYHAERPPHHGG